MMGGDNISSHNASPYSFIVIVIYDVSVVDQILQRFDCSIDASPRIKVLASFPINCLFDIYKVGELTYRDFIAFPRKVHLSLEEYSPCTNLFRIHLI